MLVAHAETYTNTQSHADDDDRADGDDDAFPGHRHGERCFLDRGLQIDFLYFPAMISYPIDFTVERYRIALYPRNRKHFILFLLKHSTHHGQGSRTRLTISNRL